MCVGLGGRPGRRGITAVYETAQVERERSSGHNLDVLVFARRSNRGGGVPYRCRPTRMVKAGTQSGSDRDCCFPLADTDPNGAVDEECLDAVLFE